MDLPPNWSFLPLFAHLKLPGILLPFPVNHKVINLAQRIDDIPETEGSKGEHGVEWDKERLIVLFPLGGWLRQEEVNGLLKLVKDKDVETFTEEPNPQTIAPDVYQVD